MRERESPYPAVGLIDLLELTGFDFQGMVRLFVQCADRDLVFFDFECDRDLGYAATLWRNTKNYKAPKGMSVFG